MGSMKNKKVKAFLIALLIFACIPLSIIILYFIGCLLIYSPIVSFIIFFILLFIVIYKWILDILNIQ